MKVEAPVKVKKRKEEEKTQTPAPRKSPKKLKIQDCGYEVPGKILGKAWSLFITQFMIEKILISLESSR